MCVHHVPSPAANAKAKIEHIYTGPSGTELAEVMADCDPEVIKKNNIWTKKINLD